MEQDTLPRLYPQERRGTLEWLLKRFSILEAQKNLKPKSLGGEQPDYLGRDEGYASYLQNNREHLKIPTPQIIKFKNLTYTAPVLDAENRIPTIGSVFLDFVFPWWRKGSRKKIFHILDNCSGYLMPGTQTLICGLPGCGKTTLLKALSGTLVIERGSTYSGTVTYNGKSLKDIFVQRKATYIPQVDRHLPLLTVRETIEFSILCKYFDANLSSMGSQDLKMKQAANTFQLTSIYESIVGDQVARGVSGGERHRVTMCEMVADTYSVCFIDEHSTGQDSSYSYSLCHNGQFLARFLPGINVYALLQPSPELFELFDRLIVLAEGQIIYQGPREDVLSYFAQLGYIKPLDVDVADFLQEVTSLEGKLFLLPGFLHLDTNSFVKAYKSSNLYREIQRVVDDPKVMQEMWIKVEKPLGLKLRDRMSMEGEMNMIEVCEVEPTGNVSKLDLINQTIKVKNGDIITGVLGKDGMLDYVAGIECTCFAADVKKKVLNIDGPVRMQLERRFEEGPIRTEYVTEFTQDWWVSTRALLSRQTKLCIRNKSFLVARLLNVLILGIITGTIFYDIHSHSDRSPMDLYRSLSFMACVIMAVAVVSQIPTIFDERKVFAKHHAAKFFRASSYVMATTLVQIPLLSIEILVYCPLLYWLAGLSSTHNGAHFFMFMLLEFEIALMGVALTKFLASICRTAETATALEGMTIVMFLMFSGFMVTKKNIPQWWIWAYYLSPMQYGVTGLPCVNTLSYCQGRMHMTTGQAYLDIYDLPTKYFNGVWVSVIALILFYMAFTSMTFFTTGYLCFNEVKLPSTARLQHKKEENRDQKIEFSQLKNISKEKCTLKTMHFGASPVGLPSVMKFEPILLSFHQIFYELDIQGVRETQVLLNGVSGYSKPGSMTALMGTSGAGKTTLLDVLAGRKTTGRIKGDILLNGYAKRQETFARVSGYVEQNDIHAPFVTVLEALEFSAALRLPGTISVNQKKTFVTEVIDLLELYDVQNNLVGAIGDGGLSIEEAKRLTIGVELVANPSIIFFDEPTSGLDSRAAQVVMRGIKKIVQSGRNAICTIHQPSRRLFLAFDQLLLLQRGGKIAYFGQIGPEAKDLLGYFHAVPGARRCSLNQNPATYMLDLIGATNYYSTRQDFSLDYLRSTLRESNWQELQRIRYGAGTLGVEPDVRGYVATWSTMMSIVLKRELKTCWRNVAYNGVRISFSVVISLLLGTSFWQIKYDNTSGMVSRLGLIYIAIALLAIMNSNTIVPQVNTHRLVYYRETASNMYPSCVYSASLALVEFSSLAFSTILFCGICCSMARVAIGNASDFFQFWLLIYEYSACLTFFGLCIALLTPNTETASVIVSIIVSLWNIISGFFISKKQIPNAWIWLYWFNPTQFALNALSTLAFYCDTTTSECQSCSLDHLTGTCPNCDCVHVQDEGNVIAWLHIKRKLQSVEHNKIPMQIGVLASFSFGFCLVGALARHFMRFQKR